MDSGLGRGFSAVTAPSKFYIGALRYVIRNDMVSVKFQFFGVGIWPISQAKIPNEIRS